MVPNSEGSVRLFESEIALLMEVLNSDKDYQLFIKAVQIDRLRAAIIARVQEMAQMRPQNAQMPQRPPQPHPMPQTQQRGPMSPNLGSRMGREGPLQAPPNMGIGDDGLTQGEYDSAMAGEQYQEEQEVPQSLPPEKGGVQRPNWMMRQAQEVQGETYSQPNQARNTTMYPLQAPGREGVGESPYSNSRRDGGTSTEPSSQNSQRPQVPSGNKEKVLSNDDFGTFSEESF